MGGNIIVVKRVRMIESLTNMLRTMGLKSVVLLSLVLFVCCVSGFFSIHLSHKWEKERRISSFNELAEIYGDHLTNEIKSLQASMPGISAYIDEDLLPSKEKFHSYVSNSNVLYEKAKFFGLALEVPFDKRADIYTELKVANGRPSFDKEVELIQPPKNNETYYPIVYIDTAKTEGDEALKALQSLQGQNVLSLLDKSEIVSLMQNENVVVSNFLPPLTEKADDGPWFYMAIPIDIVLDLRENTGVRGFFFFGMEVSVFLEQALKDQVGQNLVLYLTSSNNSSVDLEYPVMKFLDGAVESQFYETFNGGMSNAKMRYDEVIELSQGKWSFAIIPEEGTFLLEWKQVATGYIAAVGLIMFGLLASYYTVNWNASLETLVRKRTVELENMKKRAEAANKAKSEFLANMSHELRTPLNAVIGFSDIMKSGMVKDNDINIYQEYATDINKSGTHLLDIINDILDLSKVEANKMELNDSEIHLIDMVSPALAILSQHIEEKELSLSVNEKELESICMKVDEKLFKQILLNLLSNAIKFTNKGGKIDINAEGNSEDGITVVVKDNGIGMNKEDIPIALTPFSQVDGGLNRVYEGTGLGLPLVKSFTELHGGTFELLSRLNFGTSAIIRLPNSRLVDESIIPTTS